MWGWIKPIIDSLLEFLEKQLRKPTHGHDAPRNYRGIRDRFLRRVRQHRDSGAGRDSGQAG